MVKERFADNGEVDVEKCNPSRTVLPLLKFFNRHCSKSHQQLLPEEQREYHYGSQDTPSATKSASASAGTAHLSAAATADLSTEDALAFSGEAGGPDHNKSSPSTSKPATAVVIATASSRRITLCRTTLGLDVTSMPSSYEEDRKSNYASMRTEMQGGDAPESEGAAATDAATTDAAATANETSGAEKRKKLKRTEEPHFSDEELLQLLGVGSHGTDNRESTRSHSISPRKGNGTQTAQALHLTSSTLYALRMALGKASSIAKQLWDQQEQESEEHSSNNSHSVDGDISNSEEQKRVLPEGCIVIGADTIIEVDGQILEKAADEHEAKQMLMRMSGKTHSVHTAVCVFTRKEGSSKPAAATVSTTNVSFVDFTEEDVNAYVETKQYEGKSGSYGILEFAGQFVKRIDGCFFTVMGLPVQWVSAALATLYHSNEIV